MKISVVIPNFNGAQYLEETLESVLSQDYPNKEVIVIDGGSTDGSVEIIRSYEKYLAFWISERDSGQSDAINKGFRRSTGKWVNWLNSDDRLVPGALDLLAKAIRENPKADFVYGDVQIILGDGSLFQNRPETSYRSTILRYGGNLFAQPSCFFRRSVGEKLEWLDKSLHWSMDYDFWIRAARAGASFHQVRGYISQFRIHPLSKTGSQHARIRQEHFLCHRRLAGGITSAKPVYKALKFCARTWRVLLLYKERGIWQPGRYARELRRLQEKKAVCR